MELALSNKRFNGELINSEMDMVTTQNLTHAEINRSYRILGIETNDKAMKDFLFTLGCYEDGNITVISILSENYVINVKDARYSIDADLAKAILI